MPDERAARIGSEPRSTLLSAGAEAAWSAESGWRDAAWVVAYGIGWVLGYYVSTYYWFLPAGLRFASLWCSPRRLWPWLALVEFAAITFTVFMTGGYRTWIGFALGVVTPWFVHAAVVTLAAPRPRDLAPDTPRRMGRVLLAALTAAVATSVLLTVMSLIETRVPIDDPVAKAISFAIGDYIAMLVVVPIWLHLSVRRAHGWPRLQFELALVFLPLLALVTLVPGMRPQASMYAAMLGLVPMMVMVFRHGWRGAGWALALTSVAVYVLGEVFESALPREVMQLFLAIVGAVTLMLGSAVSALRRAGDALASKNATLAEQARVLRALSQRLVRAQEDEQRRIATELHGELEQGITALGTRLGMLARTPLEPAQMAAVDSLRGLTQGVHASIRDVLTRLRPEVLDRFGLERALREGPIHDLLVDAEIEPVITLRGALDRLDRDVQGAIYRICQEAATDCVRRARATRFELGIVASERDGPGLMLTIRIAYEAVAPSRPGETEECPPLAGVADRVLALGGEYECECQGVVAVHRIVLEVPMLTPADARAST